MAHAQVKKGTFSPVGKFPSSSHSKSLFYNHSKIVSNVSRNPSIKQRKHHQKLPLRAKFKMMSSPPQSPKRSHSGDEEERAAKVLKLSPEAETSKSGGAGLPLETLPIAFAAAKAPSKVEEDGYLRRTRVISYEAKIRERRRAARKVSGKWKNMPSSAQKGLQNPNVLCYRNSVLQALLHSPQIGNFLKKYHSPDLCVSSEGESCVACSLLRVHTTYWSGKAIELRKEIADLQKALVKNKWSAGANNGQADPEEFLNWLIKTLQAQLPEKTFSLLEASNTFIIESSITCPNCNHISTTHQTEGTLSVAITPHRPVPLSTYLIPNFRETLSDYRCDSCHIKGNPLRTRDIAHSPSLLVIQLKRFSWNGKKDAFAIPIASTLDLNEYRTVKNHVSSRYRLQAVVSHLGCLSSGHYRCAARGADGKWVVFDDASMKEVGEEVALDPGSGRAGGWTPYLLFFQRRES